MRVLAVAHDETTLRLCLLGLGVEGMDVVHAIDLESAVQPAVDAGPMRSSWTRRSLRGPASPSCAGW